MYCNLQSASLQTLRLHKIESRSRAGYEAVGDFVWSGVKVLFIALSGRIGDRWLAVHGYGNCCLKSLGGNI